MCQSSTPLPQVIIIYPGPIVATRSQSLTLETIVTMLGRLMIAVFLLSSLAAHGGCDPVVTFWLRRRGSDRFCHGLKISRLLLNLSFTC